MKVILQQDLKGSGRKGDLVEVSDGYARNYLIPRKLAMPADTGAMNEYRQREDSKTFHKQKALEEARALAERLQDVTVQVRAKGGSAGRLFGSVTGKDVAEALSAQIHAEVDRKKLVMEDIKTFGNFEAEAKIHPGVSATFHIMVIEE